jgi:TolB-like protein
MNRDPWLSRPTDEAVTNPERLESWKEISEYLNRAVRTVQRWEETKRLPVRRLPGGERARVFALRSELDAWWNSRGIQNLPNVGGDPKTAKPGPIRRSNIIVLPFANLSGDSDQEFLSDTFTEEFTTALACLAPDRLGVIARTTAMHYKGSNKDVSRLGHELGIHYVIEGSIRRAAEHISVIVQLIQVCDQMHLLAKRYETELASMLDTVSGATQAIAEVLGIVQAAEAGGVSAEVHQVKQMGLAL